MLPSRTGQYYHIIWFFFFFFPSQYSVRTDYFEKHVILMEYGSLNEYKNSGLADFLSQRQREVLLGMVPLSNGTESIALASRERSAIILTLLKITPAMA